MRWTRFHILIFVTLPLLGFGCGGGEEESAEKNAGIKPRTATAKPVPIAGGGDKPDAKANAKRRRANPRVGGGLARNKSPESNLPPGVDPEDLFVVSTRANTYHITATAEQRKSFTITAVPELGANSSTFTNPALVQPEPGSRPSLRVMQQRRSTNAGGPARGLPNGFEAVVGVATSENGLPLRIKCRADDSLFVLVPGGTAIRGSNDGPPDTQPAHSVLLDDFYVGIHEVTLRQFAKFREAVRGVKGTRVPREPLNAADPLDYPALGVEQLDARNYAEWAKCSIPSEAQWEKAARGATGFDYPWGNGRPVWPRHRPLNHIAPVMSFRVDVSAYGAFDMAGNAREWCLDVYHADAYKEAGDVGEKLLENPVIERVTSGGGADRVTRGNGPGWKLWHRSYGKMTDQLPDVGFRLVVNLPKPDEQTPETENRRIRPIRN